MSDEMNVKAIDKEVLEFQRKILSPENMIKVRLSNLDSPGSPIQIGKNGVAFEYEDGYEGPIPKVLLSVLDKAFTLEVPRGYRPYDRDKEDAPKKVKRWRYRYEKLGIEYDKKGNEIEKFKDSIADAAKGPYKIPKNSSADELRKIKDDVAAKLSAMEKAKESIAEEQPKPEEGPEEPKEEKKDK